MTAAAGGTTAGGTTAGGTTAGAAGAVAAGLIRVSRRVVVLGAIVAALALVAALAGLLWGGGDGASAFTTLRGDTMQVYGRGLYEHDSAFVGAGFRGSDIVTVALGVPLLVTGLVFYRRGSLRGGLALAGGLTYVLYVYASLALSAQFNPLFLVYVALFGASFYGLVLLLRAIDLAALPAAVVGRLPRRGPAAFMVAGGLVTTLVWLMPAASALTSGAVPDRSEGYTTAVTIALDLAVIAPACFVCGALLLRRAPLGYLLAFPLLGIIVMLGPGFVAQTWWQVAAGVAFATAEMAGSIGGFGLVAAFAVWVSVAILRRLPGRGARTAATAGTARAAGDTPHAA